MFEDKMIPLDAWVTGLVDWLVENHREFFQLLKWPVDKTLTGFDMGLNFLSPVVIILAVALLAWRFSGKGLAVFSIVALVFIGLLGFWEDTMTTLAMVLSSVLFCLPWYWTGLPSPWQGKIPIDNKYQ